VLYFRSISELIREVDQSYFVCVSYGVFGECVFFHFDLYVEERAGFTWKKDGGAGRI
jgi:hypothetical protein